MIVAVAIVAAAYAANWGFNHTPWGLSLKSQGQWYVFAFYLPFGVMVPAAYLGWVSRLRLAPARWLGAPLGDRDAVAAAVGFVVGGLLAVGALAPVVREHGLALPHRLFALLLIASTAEVLLFLGVLGNAVQLATRTHRWRARLLALVVPSLAFGLFHFTYPAPWNTLGRALPLTLVWVPVSMLLLASRSLVGAVILNNLLALIGFVGNGIDLPGTAAAGWLRTALACALFVAVFFLTRRW